MIICVYDSDNYKKNTLANASRQIQDFERINFALTNYLEANKRSFFKFNTILKIFDTLMLLEAPANYTDLVLSEKLESGELTLESYIDEEYSFNSSNRYLDNPNAQLDDMALRSILSPVRLDVVKLESLSIFSDEDMLTDKIHVVDATGIDFSSIEAMDPCFIVVGVNDLAHAYNHVQDKYKIVTYTGLAYILRQMHRFPVKLTEDTIKDLRYKYSLEGER